MVGLYGAAVSVGGTVHRLLGLLRYLQLVDSNIIIVTVCRVRSTQI
jgi:hypothetical protein